MKTELRRLCLLIGLAAIMTCLPARGQQESEWDELADRPFPEWFRDAKLGIFIHWGLYSVPSWSGPEQYAEWFLRGLQTGDEPRQEYLRRVYGEDFTYEDLAPLFRAELFEPEDWADLFQASGAQYVVLTSKHHDGFALWPSEHASAARGFAWNAMETGPKRDLVGELSEAVRAAGLRMGLYYSLPEWNHPIYSWGGNKPGNDVDRYVAEHMIPQFKDVMSRYKPAVIFSDGEWDHPASTWHSAELLQWLFKESGCPPDLAVNDRWGGGSKIGFRTPEYSAGAPPGDRPWAECRGLGRSFGLNRNEQLDAYLTPQELVHFFARAVSHGGGMLLNVGPGADGQIPLLQQERLRQLGSWIAVNQEAIYKAGTWQQLGEWTTHKVERLDSNIDFDWVRNAPMSGVSPDHFKATWQGYLETDADGAYLIRLEADDRATVWIDGERIAREGEMGLVYLSAGERMALKVVFEEEQHQAVCRLFWTHEDGLEGEIPPSAFYTTAAGEGHGLRASFESERQTIAYTRRAENLYAIVFDWPGKTLRLQAPKPPSESAVRLLGLERDLDWQWRDGTLEIDTSDIGINDLPCAWAWTFRVVLEAGS
jgi:alpha-L-fucosidase